MDLITSLSIGRGGLGRFGNQMFTIAGCIGIARKNYQPFAFPRWMNYDNALFGGPVDDFNNYFVNPLPQLDTTLRFNEYGYFWGYRDITLPEGNWSIDAHLQSPKFFEHCIDEVRYYFRMKDEEPQNDYCAIHYRAGDYIDNIEAYHPRQTTEYYKNAMAHFGQHQKYIVFSDNIDEAREKLGGINADFSNMNYIDDFRLMKRCKHFIIANSSFSAMAALLGEHPDKKVIAPRLWFGKQADGLPADDIYHKDWIVI